MFAERFSGTIEAVTTLLAPADPKQIATLTETIIGGFVDVPRAISGVSAGLLSQFTGGHFDYLTAGLNISWEPMPNLRRQRVFTDAGCPDGPDLHDDAAPFAVGRHDFDPYVAYQPEAWIEFACPVSAGPDITEVAVYKIEDQFAPADQQRPPQLLGILAAPAKDFDVHFVDTTQVTAVNDTLTMSGATVSGSDASCCPHHHATLQYRLQSGRFTLVQEEVHRDGAGETRLADGYYYGFVNDVDVNRITFDPIHWFTGAKAKSECKRRGEYIPPDEWCNDYYYWHDPKAALWTVPVSKGASITTLDDFTSRPHTSKRLNDLNSHLTNVEFSAAQPFAFHVVSGKLVAANQLFHP